MSQNYQRLILLLVLSTTALSSGLDFCNSQEDCGDFMICLDNECICDDDDDQSSSSGPSGGPCKSISLVGDNCSPTFLCGGGSVCTNSSDTLSICTCPFGYEVQNHTRECKRSFGFPCDDDLKDFCNPETFLSCMNVSGSNSTKTCQCHYTTQYYDADLKSCVSYEGSECDLHSWMGIQMKCGKNSYCSGTVDTGEDFYGVCKCQEGFYPENSACLPILGRDCTFTSDCTSVVKDENDHTKIQKFDLNDLSCVNNKCQCKSGLLYEPFVNPFPHCSLTIGQECYSKPGNSTTGKKCVANSSCQPNSNFTFRCECDDEFLPTSNGHCRLGHSATDCIDHPTHHLNCHLESGLKCLNNSCSCPQGFVFSIDANSCQGLDLTRCEASANCAENYECHPVQKVCKCSPSFILNTTDLQCQHGHQTKCLVDDDTCPHHLGLYCLPKTDGSSYCECKSNSTIFDNRAKRCLLKLGKHCSYPHQLCVKSAFCGTGEKCQCYDQFRPTPDGNCMLGYNQPCSSGGHAEQDSHQCNFHIGLSCSTEDKCQCSDIETVYNETVEHCTTVEVDDITPKGLTYTPKYLNSTTEVTNRSKAGGSKIILIVASAVIIIGGVVAVGIFMRRRARRSH